MKNIYTMLGLTLAFNCCLISCHSANEHTDNRQEKPQVTDEEITPAEVTIGERLFFETRFAQFFAVNASHANDVLVEGDPTLDNTIGFNTEFLGPFSGQSMNCSACHLVDQHVDESTGGMRVYADFAARPPIPSRADRGDMNTHAPRNSQSLVGSATPNRPQLLLHFDGEFSTMIDLVKATLTGRNYGWLADEQVQAISHIANVIRDDDGLAQLAQEFGGSYTQILTGTAQDIPDELRLPTSLTLDINQANDEAIFHLVSELIAIYVTDLSFATNEQGVFNGSPFDAFLLANNLPTTPNENESNEEYTKRLLIQLNQLQQPKFISHNENNSAGFNFHDQDFTFDQPALAGLKVFLQSENNLEGTASVGNCASCHALPHFSDFKLHNTGVTQTEYDQLHGIGQFNALYIPDLASRNQNVDLYLPASANHPNASGSFRAIANINNPQLTDLGAWNIFANPDITVPQSTLRQALCDINKQLPCLQQTTESLLTSAIATFKTPQLRDLDHSAPFMHNGQFKTIKDVVQFYQDISELLKTNQVRNPDPNMEKININDQDVINLSIFLKTLNEDYE